MKNVWTIARRDFRANFTSITAYLVIAGFILIMGWMFSSMVEYFARQSMQMQQFMGKRPSLTDTFLKPFLGNMNVFLLFITPFITMRIFAEEKKNHTLELLMTSPVTMFEIVFGKFLAAFLMLLVLLGATLIFPAVLMIAGNPDVGPIFTSYIGTALIVACYISFGMICSAVTENQVIAGVLTFAGLFFFWLVSWAAQNAGPVWGKVLEHLSLIGHYNNFSQGMLNSGDLIYYASFVVFCLFICQRVLDSLRWR